MNRVTLSGRLRYKPRITYTQTGACRASIFLIVPRCRGETADFITATAWDTIAEDIRDYADLGDFVEIGGVIRTRAIDAPGGKHYVQDIVIDSINFPEREKERYVNASGD